MFDLFLLNFFGDFEREQFIGVSFDSIFEISERFFGSHFESVEGTLDFVELLANIGEVVFGAYQGNGLFREREKGFCKNPNKKARAISPLFRKRSQVESEKRQEAKSQKVKM